VLGFAPAASRKAVEAEGGASGSTDGVTQQQADAELAAGMQYSAKRQTRSATAKTEPEPFDVSTKHPQCPPEPLCVSDGHGHALGRKCIEFARVR
jgi:hypothetical protein